MVGWIISIICIISQILQLLDECRDHLNAFFPSSILLAPHPSCMRNTPESGQCPPEFSLTFLGHDDKSHHWACVLYLELKTSCMTFRVPLNVSCKKVPHERVLKVLACSPSKEIWKQKERHLTLVPKHSHITMIHMALHGILLYRQTLLFSSDKTTFVFIPKTGFVCF